MKDETTAVTLVTIVDVSQVSGSGIATREIAIAFGQQPDVELTLVCPQPAERLPNRLSERVADLVFLPPVTDPGSPVWHAKMEAATLPKLARTLRSTDPDLVVTRLAPSIVVAPVLSRLGGVPYVLLVRGMVRKDDQYGQTKFGRVVDVVASLNAGVADHVYVAFEEIREWLRGIGTDTPITVAPNGVDPDLFSPQPIADARSALGLPIADDDYVVGFVGTLSPRHQLRSLVRATAAVDKRGIDITLLIVGDGVLRGQLADLAEELGIRDHVVFTGEVTHDDVPAYVCACDVLYGVVDTERPSNPIKCYEYLACGRPIITTEKDELSFVSDQDAGVVVPSLEPADVTDAIVRLAEADPAERTAMGRRGRKCILENHTWDRLAERVLTQASGSEAGNRGE